MSLSRIYYSLQLLIVGFFKCQLNLAAYKGITSLMTLLLSTCSRNTGRRILKYAQLILDVYLLLVLSYFTSYILKPIYVGFKTYVGFDMHVELFSFLDKLAILSLISIPIYA